MLAPMGVLAAACIIIGISPPVLFAPAIRAGAAIASVDATSSLQLVADVSSGAARVGTVAGLVVIVAALIWLMRSWMLRRVPVEAADTWGCGYEGVTPRMQYTASSFAAPLVTAFAGLSGVRTRRDDRHFHTQPADLVLDRLVFPAWARVRGTAMRLRTIQLGRLHVYLLYIIITLVLLLAYLGASVRR
jgi:hypothetical protein